MTGQHPKRRETDKDARRRADRLDDAWKAYLKTGRRVGEVEGALLKANRPRISASGRLVGGLS